MIQWPSGLTETYEDLPVNRRIEIQEGTKNFTVKPFASPPQSWAQLTDPLKGESPPLAVGTWLIDPVRSIDFSIPDLAGNLRDLRSFRENPVLLNFWSTACASCRDQLQVLRRSHATLVSKGLQIVAVNIDAPSDPAVVKSFASQEELPFTVLLATPAVAGIYNIVYRYLFDRHRDLSLPMSLLIDEAGNIVKVYQGAFSSEVLSQDLVSMPKDLADRVPQSASLPRDLASRQFST